MRGQSRSGLSFLDVTIDNSRYRRTPHTSHSRTYHSSSGITAICNHGSEARNGQGNPSKVQLAAGWVSIYIFSHLMKKEVN
jgi:hypothetical protein